MLEIALCRKGGVYVPYSEDDRQAGRTFPEYMPLIARLSGTKNPRAIRELRGYFGSCQYISELDLNENMNTKHKVDHLTRLKLNFVDGTVFDDRGLLHWIVKSLSYANCDQPEAHAFITRAFELHAELAGIDDVERYLKHLRELVR